MLYAIKIAARYLSASKAQTALLVVGVAVGVFVFIFMSALIGGLAEFILARTAGDMAHVTIEAEARSPARLTVPPGRVLWVEQATRETATLRAAENFLPLIEALPEVKAVSPQIIGAGVLRRGGQEAQVSIVGLEPGRETAILDLERYRVAGSVRLGAGVVVLGKGLVEDLGLSLNQSVVLQSSHGGTMRLTLGGIYEIGAGAADRRMAYVSLATARSLMALPQGLSRIEIKLFDLYAADASAARLRGLTGLPAVSWTREGARLLEALKAQKQTGYFLKSFAMITIIIGVASSLLLSTYRRRPEIGIMRAMGASRRFVVGVFVLQGGLIGAMGGLLGATTGYGVLLAFPTRENFRPGTLPMDITQGAYGLAITLTVLCAIAAAILPARAAARLDPVTAIGQ
ncbi:ABC transporter permease (plasmid) [Rhodobacter capsulatus]|uniref:ABC transporter permease n=1 Tax=Rhodobacter capsulatus TaxID=1061 RepID=UPI0011437DFA|nr:ABC transporter permease [Rhodobacter capsulatus]TQD33309.1 ABC transporter permease [Rhodobacter capsulatus]